MILHLWLRAHELNIHANWHIALRVKNQNREGPVAMFECLMWLETSSMRNVELTKEQYNIFHIPNNNWKV